MQENLQETRFFNFTHPAILDMVEEFRSQPESVQISGLFSKVRDGWRYNPFNIFTKEEHYTASFLATQPEGHCIDKSTLFITGMRALGYPARLRLAKVVNHIAVEQLTQKLGTRYIAPHGIAEVYVNGIWRKASTAFNKTLCERYHVDPLEFDGSADAVIQAFNREQKPVYGVCGRLRPFFGCTGGLHLSDL